jgi:hypothetical protein
VAGRPDPRPTRCPRSRWTTSSRVDSNGSSATSGSSWTTAHNSEDSVVPRATYERECEASGCSLPDGTDALGLILEVADQQHGTREPVLPGGVVFAPGVTRTAPAGRGRAAGGRPYGESER